MKVVLLSVGKTDEDFYVRAIEMFKKRLSHYIPFELDFVPDVKTERTCRRRNRNSSEGEAILNRIQPGDHVVLLDDKGKQYSSMEFSAFIEKRSHRCPNGLFLSLADLTWICRPSIRPCKRETVAIADDLYPPDGSAGVCGQLYRAMTILNGEPYHHE